MENQKTYYHCKCCDEEPFVFERYKEPILLEIKTWCSSTDVQQQPISNSYKRNKCYRMFSQYIINGRLGKEIRKELRQKSERGISERRWEEIHWIQGKGMMMGMNIPHIINEEHSTSAVCT